MKKALIDTRFNRICQIAPAEQIFEVASDLVWVTIPVEIENLINTSWNYNGITFSKPVITTTITKTIKETLEDLDSLTEEDFKKLEVAAIEWGNSQDDSFIRYLLAENEIRLLIASWLQRDNQGALLHGINLKISREITI